MRIPNCRSEYILDFRGEPTEEKNPYYEGNLDDLGKRLLQEYDFAVESMSLFFDNLDVVDFDIQGEDMNLGRILENHPAMLERLRDGFARWAESTRNENIVSMIESD